MRIVAGFAVLAFGFAAAFAGCSDSGGSDGEGGGKDAGQSGAGGGPSDAGGGIEEDRSPEGCKYVKLGRAWPDNLNDPNNAQVFRAQIIPNIGNETPDYLRLEFTDTTTAFDEELRVCCGYTGTPPAHVFATPPDCVQGKMPTRCRGGWNVFVDVDYVDVVDTGRTFVARNNGVIVIDRQSNLAKGTISAKFDGVVLQEVDGETFEFLKSGGECLEIRSTAELKIDDIPGWTCNLGYYGFADLGDYCDCRCGIWDPDCDDRDLKIRDCGRYWGAGCEADCCEQVCERVNGGQQQCCEAGGVNCGPVTGCESG